MDKEYKELNYRELQALAKKLKLPGNLKQHLLVEAIEARKRGNEVNVQKILTRQKIERAKRRCEKVEGREAVYGYLKIKQEKRAPGRPRKHPIQNPQFQNVRLNENSTTPDLRALLSMSPQSFQQFYKQSKIPSNEVSANDVEQTRLQGGSYCNQVGAETYEVANYPVEENCSKTCQSHLTGGSVKEQLSQSLTSREYFGKNGGGEISGQFVNNSDFMKDLDGNSSIVCSDGYNRPLNIASDYTKVFDGSSSLVYSDGYTRAIDKRRSFQIRDILANKYNESMTVSCTALSHKSASLAQCHNYTGMECPGPNGYSGMNSYFPQSLPELPNVFYGNRDNNSFPSYPPVYHPMNQGQWVNPWGEDFRTQDLYWKHENQMNIYQVSASQGVQATYSSPDSDTQSATEQDFENILTEQESPNPELKFTGQINYPMFHNTLPTENQVYSQSTVPGLLQNHFEGSIGQSGLVGQSQHDPTSNMSEQFSTDGTCMFDKNSYPLTHDFAVTF